jgi:anti-sigma regulatory factor (Ser/Thr protein kinase)
MKDLSNLEQHLLYSGKMAIRSEQAGLYAARKRIAYIAKGLDFGSEDIEDLMIAVGEAVTNAYVHGTAEPGKSMIYLGWHCEGDTLTVIIKDRGLNGSHVPLAGQRVKMLGLGVKLMRSLMNEVNIQYRHGTTVTLKKRNQLLIRQ